MVSLFLRKGLSALAVAATLLAMAPGAAFASSLSAPSHLDLVSGIYTNDTTPTATWTRPANATWYEILVDDGDWIGISNVGSYTIWALPNGWHTFYVRAHSNTGAVSTSSSITFEIDTQGPTVSTVSPNTATEDVSTTFSVTSSGEAATLFCDLYVDGKNTGGMTKKSLTNFSKPYTFTTSGSHTVYARCMDGDNNYTTGASRTVTVTNGDNSPTDETFWVNGVTPTSATEDESTTMRVTTSGTLDADSCVLYVNSSSVGTMSETSANSFAKTYTFANDGSYTVYAYCEDAYGNWERGASKTVTVHATDNEDETFTVPSVSPSSATEDEELTFRVTPYGTLDAETCKLYVNGSSVGTMDESGGTFRMDYTFTNDGEYTVYAYCEDENGNWEKGSSRTVEVSNDTTSNNGSLDVPTVSPSSADEDERTEFTVKPTSDYNVTNCWLYVDGSRVATMDEESTNRFVADYTFSNDGSYSVYATCKDSSGESVTGDKRTVRVGTVNSTSNDDVDRGSLIKTRCGASPSVNDACKAVYYYGEDGKRHVFPNEATYFTWYRDFDDVVEVSSGFMASLTIGKNVTLRPGSVLVKFDSASSIYAVEKDHTLRRYTKTSLIESDYGDDYEDVLVTISDSLYNNYSVGSVIDSTNDFDRDDEYFSVDSIDDVL